ncbi:MAG: endonuclease III [Calditrichia bacterium]
MLKKTDVNKVLEILEKEYGNTGTALKFQSPFQLLVSTMLAAQSTDKQVNKITSELYRQYPEPKDFIRLSQDELEEKIKSIGLYRNKAKNILSMVRMLVSEYGSVVPQTREELVRLPGVGRKTANVVLSVGFRHDAIAVDTHVFRVSNRIGLASAKNVRETEEQLMKNIPQKDWSSAHHWLIWHGRQICRAQNPRCEICPVQEFCEYYKSVLSEK